MKQIFHKKTAQVTVLMLIISVLMPVLAYAGFNLTTSPLATYNNNLVTGSVYSGANDPYSSVGAQVYVYDPNGVQLGPVTASTYSYDVSTAVYKYQFTYTTPQRFGYVKLQEVTTSVYSVVYDSTPSSGTGSSGGSSGGGGGGGGGSVSGSTINVSSDGTIDSYSLINALTNADEITLNLSGDIALIPAKALVDFTSNKAKTLRITNTKGTYILPIYVLNLSELATQLGTTVDELIIKASISAPSADVIASISAAAAALGGTEISAPVDFNIVGLAKDGKTQVVNLGSTYTSRILPLTKAADTTRATGVVFDPATKKLSFVPATFSSSDSINQAVLKRNSNSIYTALEFNKSFPDSKGHWAQGYIELLANKLVIDGVTDTTFEPERNITRAEFAALVVRALGLEQAAGSGSFNDVTSGDWFAGVVGAATNAKIIDGYEDSTFRPNQPIKREELAAMVVRALSYAGAKPDVTSTRQSELLAKFTDASTIVWAQQEVATAIEAGIIDGITDSTIAPISQATRAQSATMLKRLLTKANFIN
jgi:N-acetylmuramoyl-L-alanine amidase